MDGVSAVASVAGIAAAGFQLSKVLYDTIETIKTGEAEIGDIASNISLLSLVLKELQVALDHERAHFRPLLEENARTIISRCESIFEDIKHHTADKHGKTRSRVS